MQLVRAGQPNTVGYDVLTKTTSDPVTEGVEVALYLIPRSGPNKGKWWDGTEWSDTESPAIVESEHESRGHWIAEIPAEAWQGGVSYRFYGVASGGDYIVHSTDVWCLTSTGAWPEGAGDWPVSVAELKAHLRIDADDTDEDALLASYIAAATEWAEQYNGRKFLLTTCVDALNSFPYVIRPRHCPLHDVTSIVYLDNDGAEQTLDAETYRVTTRTEPGRVAPAYSESWPSHRTVNEAIVVTYRAGYGEEPTDVPQIYRNAIMMIAGSLYEHREEVSPIRTQQIPFGAKSLLGINRLVPV